MIRPQRVYLLRQVKDYMPGMYPVGSIDYNSKYVTLEKDETTRLYFAGPDIHVKEPMDNTRFVDKDAEPIYEGDIVRHPRYGRGEVIFSQTQGKWVVQLEVPTADDLVGISLDSQLADELKIVGHVFEDLPKQGQEGQNESPRTS